MAFNPVVESMEGAALHYTCLMENIPFPANQKRFQLYWRKKQEEMEYAGINHIT